MALMDVIETLQATETMTDVDLVADYGDVDLAIKALEKRKEALRAKVILLAEATQATRIEGADGTYLEITRKEGSSRIDAKKARALLSEEVIATITTVGAPQVAVSFKRTLQ